jgi:DNA-binding Xre family transcriptional regulator
MKKLKPRRKLRNRIESSKYTKKEVAKKLGLSSAQLTYILSGRKQYIHSVIIDELCYILDCRPDQIVGKYELEQYCFEIGY